MLSEGMTANRLSEGMTADRLSKGMTANRLSEEMTANKLSEEMTATRLSKEMTATTLSEGMTATKLSERMTANRLSEGDCEWGDMRHDCKAGVTRIKEINRWIFTRKYVFRKVFHFTERFTCFGISIIRRRHRNTKKIKYLKYKAMLIKSNYFLLYFHAFAS
jgi:hypothetical protein